MPRTWRFYYLLAVAAMIVLSLALRMSGARIIAIVAVLVLAAVIVAGPILASLNARRTSAPRVTKNVTPLEPAISPPVIVVEPPRSEIEDLESKLQALDRLRTTGLVTEAEYETKRKQLIADA